MLLYSSEERALVVKEAIQTGDVKTLETLLKENPELAQAGIKDGNVVRSLLHIATDYPGHYPNARKTIELLVKTGADVNASFIGPHKEKPLHWAASNDDVESVEILVQLGADLEADGGVIGNGTPLDDARIFGQWNAARRLVELGAKTRIFDEAALGLMEKLRERFATKNIPQRDIDCALWNACHAGQLQSAQDLLEQGANINWLPEWEEITPLDIAIRSEATELVEWLKSQGAKSAKELN